MREIIQADRYIPPWNLVYLNLSNNARQRKTSDKTRNESSPDVQRSRDHDHSAKLQNHLKHSDNLHSENLSNAERINSAGNDFNELNYVLMRENIEKIKRIKILKQAKLIFNDMFTRVQGMTNDLKVQLDDALKEQRKANTIVKRLHNHIAGMQGAIDFRCENDTLAVERGYTELVPRQSSRRLILPKIESANSSRACSLPDIFKVDSSDQSPGGEELRVSRTRNIRKIAEKKSHEKSVMVASSTLRNKTLSEISRKKPARRDRNIVKTVNSANSKSSVESVRGQLDRRNQNLNHLYDLLSGSSTSNNASQQKVRDNSANKWSIEADSNIFHPERAQKEISNTTVASMTRRKELNRKCFQKTSVNQITGKAKSSKNHQYSDCPYWTELVNEKDLILSPRNHFKTNQCQLPKLKKEQIVEKIRSIEECIIKPQRGRKESAKTTEVHVNYVQKEN